MNDETHPLAALGPAPYKLLGFETVDDREEGQAARRDAGEVYTTNLCGGTCDLCGTAIFNVARIRCSDGRVIKLGCDCVERVFNPRGPIVTAAKRFIVARKTAQRKNREAARIANLVAAFEADSELGCGQPHPSGFTGTLREWAEWMLKNAGNAGKLKAARAFGF